MGIFDGIIDAVTGGFGSILDIGSDILGGLFDKGPSISDLITAFGPSAVGAFGSSQQNEANAEIAAANRAFQAAEAEKSRTFNRDEAYYNRTWMHGMSNTSWQRGVADMQAAGLNPMLAYQKGGATAGSGSAASQGSIPSGATYHAENVLGSGVNTAFQSARLVSELKKQNAETELLKAQIPKVAQEVKTSASSASQMEAQAKSLSERLRVLMPEEHSYLVSGTRLRNTQAATEQERKLDVLESRNLKVLDQLLGELDIPRRLNERNAQYGGFKREVSPYLQDVGRLTNSAWDLATGASRYRAWR